MRAFTDFKLASGLRASFRGADPHGESRNTLRPRPNNTIHVDMDPVVPAIALEMNHAAESATNRFGPTAIGGWKKAHSCLELVDPHGFTM